MIKNTSPRRVASSRVASAVDFAAYLVCQNMFFFSAAAVCLFFCVFFSSFTAATTSMESGTQPQRQRQRHSRVELPQRWIANKSTLVNWNSLAWGVCHCACACVCVCVCTHIHLLCRRSRQCGVCHRGSLWGHRPLIVVRVACAMHFWRIVCMPHMFASSRSSVGGTSGG